MSQHTWNCAMSQVGEPIIRVYFWEPHLEFFTLCMHQCTFNLVTHAADLGSEALTQAIPGATCIQSLCKHTPATMKQVSTLIRRAEKYLWERHIFSLLSCVRICVRGAVLLSKKNEKMNIQFNYILGDLFSQSIIIKHTWNNIVKLHTGCPNESLNFQVLLFVSCERCRKCLWL